VRRLGALDIGQAAIVCAGLVLTVEAAEGTDAMIQRRRSFLKTFAAAEPADAACSSRR